MVLGLPFFRVVIPMKGIDMSTALSTTNPDWLNDPHINVVYRPKRLLTGANGQQLVESFGHVWTLRIDMGGGGFLVLDCDDMQRPLVWDVIAKLEEQVQHLQSILNRLEWGDEDGKGGAA